MRRILRPSAAIRSRSEAAACWLAEQIDVAEQPAAWRGRFGRFGGNPGLYRQSREGFGQIPSAIRAIFYYGRACGLLAPISGSTAAPSLSGTTSRRWAPTSGRPASLGSRLAAANAATNLIPVRRTGILAGGQ